MERTGLRHTEKTIAILTMQCLALVATHTVIRTCCRTFDTGTVTAFFKTYVCRDRDLNTRPSACEANALTTCTTVAVELSPIQ